MKKLIFLICCVVGMSPLPSAASCFELIRETHSEFEAFVQCTNTLKDPKYEITHHYFGENYVGLFFFDRPGAGMVCNEYEIGQNNTVQCRSSSIRNIPKQYKNDQRNINMLNLDESTVEEIRLVFQPSDIFRYPDVPEDVIDDNCFVVVSDPKNITMGYRNKEQFMDLAHCLVEFERFMKKNYKLFRKK